MRSTAIAITAGLLLAAPLIGSGPALAQNPGQLLQGLLSGNQNQDQSVREAYERGYRQGREDQVRDDRNNRRGPPPPPRGPYPDQDQYQNQNQNQPYPRNQYQR